MLKRHSQLLLTLMVLADLAVTAAAWLLAYYFHFEWGVLLFQHGNPGIKIHIWALPFVCAVALYSYRASHMYIPRREGHFHREILHILRANILAVIILIAVSFALRPRLEGGAVEWSRGMGVLFVGLNSFGLTLERALLRWWLRWLRQRGWNLRHVLIVGAGRLGQALAERIERNPWTGLNVIGFVDDDPQRIDRTYYGKPVLGLLADLPKLLAEHKVDQLFIALPFAEQSKLPAILEATSEHTVDLRMMPDLLSFVTLNPRVGEFDGLPILSLKESPLQGWNAVMKRALDIILSLVLMPIWGSLTLFFAALVKLTSRGPAFYTQERMGLDERVFNIVKLRSMRVDAEAESGAVWAKPEDERCTPLGRFMRRWNIDELPQFWNVLKGDMSIVGPRPERPVFIEQFKRTVPKYMLRHKMKAGITGWAQVNGWRGDTSLEKRIQYDLYYIENWSIWLDLWIILLTPFARKNAY